MHKRGRGLNYPWVAPRAAGPFGRPKAQAALRHFERDSQFVGGPYFAFILTPPAQTTSSAAPFCLLLGQSRLAGDGVRGSEGGTGDLSRDALGARRETKAPIASDGGPDDPHSHELG